MRVSEPQRVFADPSPLVSRRLGFATLPLACLVIRVVMQAIGMATRRKQDDVLFSAAEGQEVLSFWHSEGVKWAGIAVGTLICWVWCVSPFSPPSSLLDESLLKLVFVGLAQSGRVQDHPGHQPPQLCLAAVCDDGRPAARGRGTQPAGSVPSRRSRG